jgi:hypothetical protein
MWGSRKNINALPKIKCGWLVCAALLAIAPGALSAQSVAISPGYTTIGVNETL